MPEYEIARGIHTGLIWGGPYISAQLKTMWGPCGVNLLGPYGATHMSPRGISHVGPCVETHMGVPGLILCVAHIGYNLWDFPTWVTHGTYVGQPIWACPAKTYLGPTNSCYLGCLLVYIDNAVNNLFE